MMSDKEVLRLVSNFQYEWISQRLKELRKKEKLASTLATSAVNTLKGTSLYTKLDDEFNQKYGDKSLEEVHALLTPEQRSFLRKHTIDQDAILKHFKKIKQFYIKVRRLLVI
jgi:hypothetical protein